MELKVKEITLPESIEFNYLELKKELEEKVSVYSAMVYTDDQIKEAKADKAQLNKLKKALNDERIRREKEYMVPFNTFKAQVNEIISIIDKPVAVIDSQVKAYEEKQKQEKKEAVIAYFDSIEHPEWLSLPQIMDERWLNASASMKSVQDAVDSRLEQISNDITTLSNLPEFGFEATEVYKSSLDMNKALNEGHRLSEIQKQKAAYEATQAAKLAEQMAQKQEEEFMNPPVQEEEEKPKTWVNFSAFITVDQARELKKFFDDRAIEFKPI